MRIKQALFLFILGIVGILVGLAGFLLAPLFNWPDDDSFGITLTGIKYGPGASTNTLHVAIPNDKDFFDGLFRNVVLPPPPRPLLGQEGESDVPVSAVLPHHLVAGSYEIGMLSALAQKITPPVVVLVSPNHFNTGRGKVITAQESWQTPYGLLEANPTIIKKLADAGVVIDDLAIQNEHGVGALVSLIKRIWPDTRIVPIIVKNERNFEQIDEVAGLLGDVLPKNSLLLASVDFSHYLPKEVANWHDELSINVLQTGDYNRLSRLEIDCQNCFRLLLKYNELKKAQNFNLAFHTNSADIIKNPELAETTSHVMGYFTTTPPTPSSKEGDNGVVNIPLLTRGGRGGSIAAPITAVQFFGDMMLDRNVAKLMGDKGLDYIFENLKGQENRFFYGADLFVANLEGPFAPERVKTSKEIAFRFDPALAAQLKRYNFSAFSLANNHTFDMDRKNYDFTKIILEQNNLGYFGNEYGVAAGDIWVAGPDENLPEKVAFVGLNFTEGGVSDAQIKSIVAAAKQQAQNVIVMPHWGQEYDRISNATERNRAHVMIDAGATAVVGAHPHVIQEMEIYKGAPIFYSLGNFVFDQYFSQETQEGLSVGLTFSQGSVKNIYVFPLYSVKSQNYLMTGERRDKFFEWFNKNSRIEDKKFENSKLELN